MKKTSAILWTFIVLFAIIIMAVSCGKGKSNNPVDPSEDEIYAIKGMVSEGNSGLAGVSVHITGNGVNKTVNTDSNGAYTFSNIANGAYTITPSKTDYTFNPASVTVTISGSDKTAQTIIATKFGSESHEIPNITFVSIPGGMFEMGDTEWNADSYEKPVHTVTVSGFQMSEAEITIAQYCAWLNLALERGEVMVEGNRVKGTKGTWSGNWYLDLCYPTVDAANIPIKYNNGVFYIYTVQVNLPVTSVTWYGAKAFCEGNGWDLPREAEWEYACRGGKQNKFGTDDGTISSRKANYFWGSMQILFLAEVKRFPKNPFGLYDMSGNVSEWCADWYGSYTAESQTDPIGAQTGSARVVRGGGWGNSLDSCRSAARGQRAPDYRNKYTGFRVVRRSAK